MTGTGTIPEPVAPVLEKADDGKVDGTSLGVLDSVSDACVKLWVELWL